MLTFKLILSEEMELDTSESVSLDIKVEVEKAEEIPKDDHGRVKVTQSLKNRKRKLIDKTYVDKDDFMGEFQRSKLRFSAAS